ncbi:MAG: FixH family protein [Alphaproteobacteria bacterium]|nr:FixH family protein [Alphaproteobacteria bacterium]
MSEDALPNPKDKWIPWYFVIFFAVIAILDGTFVYMAVSTQTGVVTEQPYEKGLAYNDVLEQAKTQPQITQKPRYENGLLRWQLADQDGRAITNAQVTARITRPVQEGYDFDITLDHVGGGVYQAKLNAPLPGLWMAKLSSQWDNTQYQTRYEFVTK